MVTARKCSPLGATSSTDSTLTSGGSTLRDLLGSCASGTRVGLPATDIPSAYYHSAATLNYIHGAIDSGIADLRRPFNWDLGHVKDPQLNAKYSEVVDFMENLAGFYG